MDATKVVVNIVTKKGGGRRFVADADGELSVGDLITAAALLTQIAARASDLGLEGTIEAVMKEACRSPIKVEE